MKENLIINLLAGITFCACVQGQGMPVYDNTNFVTLGKQIVETTKQTSELLKMVEFLHEQKVRIEKVSGVVKELNAVREISKNNEKLFTLVRDDLKQILNSPYIHPEEVDRVSESFNEIMENSLDDLHYVTQILTSDYLNMNDAERSQILKDRERKSREMVAEIQRKTNRYQDIISFREMQYKINNRQAHY